MKISEIKELAESGLNHSVPPFPTLAQHQELAEATLKLCELVMWAEYDESDYRSLSEKAKELGLEIE